MTVVDDAVVGGRGDAADPAVVDVEPDAAGAVPAGPSPVMKVTVPCSCRSIVLAITIWPSATLAGRPIAPPQNHVEEMAPRGAATGIGRISGPPARV